MNFHKFSHMIHQQMYVWGDVLFLVDTYKFFSPLLGMSLKFSDAVARKFISWLGNSYVQVKEFFPQVLNLLAYS